MWILTQWKLVLTASAIFALALMTSLWKVAIAERDLARQELVSYEQAAAIAATNAKATSDRTIQEIKHEHQVQTAAIEKNAFANARLRFGTCPAAGVSIHAGMPAGNTVHNSQAGSALGVDALQIAEPVAVTREFIETCASDASMTLLWSHWATRNGLPVGAE